MTGTQLVVLVIALILSVPLSLFHLAAMLWLAERQGRKVQQVSRSNLGGYTVTFLSENEDRRADSN